MKSSDLLTVLERSRGAGFLGPGPVADHIQHSIRFLDAVRAGMRLGGASDSAVETLRLVDLGSGGGVPALPLLLSAEEITAVLVDSSQKRCSFLVWAAAELGLSDRIEVWCGRAEEFGHEATAREHFDVATARGFGPPAVTVECAAPLLRLQGVLAISEPPGGRTWPAAELTHVGLTHLSLDQQHRSIALFERTGPIEERFPRSSKDQQRAPLFVL